MTRATDVRRIGDWIEYGMSRDEFGSKRIVRRWLNEARGRFPVIDRVAFPDTGKNRRAGGNR